MEIKKIVVKKLFGLFDHVIPIDNKEKITVIFGPNGIGKTTILDIVNNIARMNYLEIAKIPFQEFLIEFTEGVLAIKRGDSIKDKHFPAAYPKITFRYKDNEFIPAYKFDREFLPLRMIERTIPLLRRIGQETWLHVTRREELSLQDVFSRYGDQLSISGLPVKPPHWFTELLNNMDVHNIGTQRLFRIPTSGKLRPHEFDNPKQWPKESYDRVIPAVENYSRDIISKIQDKLSAYAELSQKLDRSFPKRLVQKTIKSLPEKKLKEKFSELEKKSKMLQEAGILENIESIDTVAIKRSNLSVLSVLVTDVEKKLSVFDELAPKINLLVQSINNRFEYKKMFINKNRGLIFKNAIDKEIPLSNLSSGEQHELVLLYELLFNMKKNSLLLIDEPEISLHVLWQQKFLDDLLNIIKMVDFKALIATHSPQIVHNYWNLTVSLGEKKSCE